MTSSHLPSVSAAMTSAHAEDERDVGKLCDQLLDLLRQTCGRELNEDGTEWCALKRGHDGSCRGLPGGVTL